MATPPPSPLRVLSGGAPQQILRDLAPDIERAVARPVEFTFEIVGSIIRRLEGGERADVVMLPLQLLDALGMKVALRPGSRRLIARVGIGVIVRAGAALPDIANAAAVRDALLAARKVALPDPGTPSGSHLARTIAQLGIAEAMAGKTVNKGAIHGGGELVARGEADLGLYLVSEVRAVLGIAIAGLLPAPLQSHVVYAAAIPASAIEPVAADAFIRFITDPAHAAAWQSGGFEGGLSD